MKALAALAALCSVHVAGAEPAPPVLAGLAPADDARLAIPIGPGGQVYLPDGKGAWLRAPQYATATVLATFERGSSGVYASGGGAVYRLAPTGWSAVRIVQRGAARSGTGRRALAAIGRDLYDLDRAVNASGEPVKIATSPMPVTAIGGPTIATANGLARLEGTKLVALRGARPATPINDRWAFTSAGAVDLRAARTIAWPTRAEITAADAGPDGTLLAASTDGELVTVTGDHANHIKVPIDHPGRPVGVVADRAGRVAVAFADGRIALRDHDAWTIATVDDHLPPPRPGAPPATAP